MKKTFSFILLTFLTVFNLHAASFTPGNIVVVRIGDGSIALSGSAFPVFLEEYTITGTLVQVIQLPIVVSGSNRRFVLTGTSTSEGNLTLSGDKHFITLAGYDADVGTATVATTAGISRVAALISDAGVINTSTYFSDGFTGSNIRGAYTMDGTSFWLSGTASPAASGGVRYLTLGGLTSVQITNTVTNTRFVYIYNGQLYVSASSGAFLGVNSVGTGIPTTTGQTTVNYINTLTGSSSYGLAFSPDGNTCYIADDRATTSSGGVQKWTYNGTAWSLAYVLNTNLTTGCRGLTVNFSGSSPVIFAVSNTNLVTATDAGATSPFTTLMTCATNTIYRGVSFAPIAPAPSAPGLVSPANNSTGNPTSLTLVWNKSVTATSYRAQVATDSLFNTIIINDSTLTDSTKSISGLSNNTKYWWRVNAKNAGGTSAYSSSFKFTTILAAPSAPSLVSPVNNSTGNPTTLNLVWNKSATASSYRVQLATDSLFNTLVVNDSTLTDSTRSVTGLSNLTAYWWRVNAKNAGGTSSYSGAYKFTTIVAVPPPPVLLFPSNNSGGNATSLTFIWNRSLNAASYRFVLALDNSFTTIILNDSTITDSTRFVTGLSNLTTYWWKVYAKNAAGTSASSAIFTFSTNAAVPPPPLLVSPANNSVGNLTALTLVWNKSLNATSYRVQLSSDSLFNTLILNDSTLTDSTRAISGLNPLTSYWWRVNAKSSGGTSAYSLTYKFRTLGVPAQITGTFIPANGATNQPTTINFKWSRAFDQTLSKILKSPGKFNSETVSNYWFELTTDSVSLAGIIRDSTLADTNKTQSGLNYSTSYYWRVKAKNQIGWGSFSFWQKLTTAPPPPATVTLKVIPGGFYDPATGTLRMRDTVKVYLVDSATCLRVDSNKVVIDSVTFTTNLSFSNAPTGNYYLYIYHRNHLPVASRYRQNIVRGSNVTYDLTTDSAKAYGFYMIKVSSSPVRWAMIPGDANRDEFIDGLDQTAWILQNGLDGYQAADFNGDGFVDGLDQTIWILYNGSSSSLPCLTPALELSFDKLRTVFEKANQFRFIEKKQMINQK